VHHYLNWIAREGFAQFVQQSDIDLPYVSARAFRERHLTAALGAGAGQRWF
jgi:hypothetical protein